MVGDRPLLVNNSFILPLVDLEILWLVVSTVPSQRARHLQVTVQQTEATGLDGRGEGRDRAAADCSKRRAQV